VKIEGVGAVYECPKKDRSTGMMWKSSIARDRHFGGRQTSSSLAEDRQTLGLCILLLAVIGDDDRAYECMVLQCHPTSALQAFPQADDSFWARRYKVTWSPLPPFIVRFELSPTKYQKTDLGVGPSVLRFRGS